VPLHALAHELDLPPGLLDVVLADDVDARLDGLPDPVVSDGLGDAHEPHPGRVAAGPRGGGGDPLPDAEYVFPHLGHAPLLVKSTRPSPLSASTTSQSGSPTTLVQDPRTSETRTAAFPWTA